MRRRSASGGVASPGVVSMGCTMSRVRANRALNTGGSTSEHVSPLRGLVSAETEMPADSQRSAFRNNAATSNGWWLRDSTAAVVQPQPSHDPTDCGAGGRRYLHRRRRATPSCYGTPPAPRWRFVARPQTDEPVPGEATIDRTMRTSAPAALDETAAKERLG